jgi:hypothetical protein
MLHRQAEDDENFPRACGFTASVLVAKNPKTRDGLWIDMLNASALASGVRL